MNNKNVEQTLVAAINTFLEQASEGLDSYNIYHIPAASVKHLSKALAGYRDKTNPADNIVPEAPVTHLEPTQAEQVVTSLEMFVRSMFEFDEVKKTMGHKGGGLPYINAITNINRTRAELTETLAGTLNLPVSPATRSWSAKNSPHFIPKQQKNKKGKKSKSSRDMDLGDAGPSVVY